MHQMAATVVKLGLKLTADLMAMLDISLFMEESARWGF